MSVVRTMDKEVVVDASPALKWALPEPYEKEAIALLKHWRKQNASIIAPLIFHAEVDSAIRRKVFDGELTVSQGRKAYALVDAFPVVLTNVKGGEARGHARSQSSFINGSCMIQPTQLWPSFAVVSSGQRIKPSSMLSNGDYRSSDGLVSIG